MRYTCRTAGLLALLFAMNTNAAENSIAQATVRVNVATSYCGYNVLVQNKSSNETLYSNISIEDADAPPYTIGDFQAEVGDTVLVEGSGLTQREGCKYDVQHAQQEFTLEEDKTCTLSHTDDNKIVVACEAGLIDPANS